jgi:hypothetical protein
MPTSKKKPRPFTFLAVICERALNEVDGVSSIIRMIDVIAIRGSTDEMTPGAVAFTIGVGFRAGGFRGKKQFKIRGVSPAGKKMQMMAGEMDFNEETGALAYINTSLAVKSPGQYWFDVILGEKRMARIPLTIKYEKATPANSPAPPGSHPHPNGKAKKQTPK